MAKHNFLQLLGTLSQVELSEFGRHLRAEKQRKKIVVQVFDHCRRYYPALDFDIEVAARKLFPQAGAAMPPRKALLNVFSELYGLLKDFLLAKKLADDTLESRLLWLLVQKERGMKADFEKGANRILEEVRAAPKADSTDYLTGIVANYWAYFDDTVVKSQNEAALLSLHNELTMFNGFLATKVGCEIQNWKRQGKGGSFKALADEVTIEFHPLRVLYDKAYKLFIEGSEDSYLALEGALMEHAGHISRKEVYTFFVYLKNYCSSRLRDGDQATWTMAHRLDKFALAHGLFLEDNGFISTTQFFNIVNAAGNSGAYTWAENFLATNLTNINPALQNEVLVISNAILAFTGSDFGQVLVILRKLDVKRLQDVDFVMRGRSLRLISCFELAADDIDLFDEVASFKAYLSRVANPNSDAVKATANFLTIFHMVISRKKHKAVIQSEIDAAKSLYFKAWLQSKLKTYKCFM